MSCGGGDASGAKARILGAFSGTAGAVPFPVPWGPGWCVQTAEFYLPRSMSVTTVSTIKKPRTVRRGGTRANPVL